MQKVQQPLDQRLHWTDVLHRRPKFNVKLFKNTPQPQRPGRHNGLNQDSHTRQPDQMYLTYPENK
jgi:hypothetical protein